MYLNGLGPFVMNRPDNNRLVEEDSDGKFLVSSSLVVRFEMSLRGSFLQWWRFRWS